METESKRLNSSQSQVISDSDISRDKPDIGSSASISKPNRHVVETRKGQVILKNQSTSDIEIGEDLCHENFSKRSSASQTEPDRFQDTRLISPVILQQRSIEAMKKKEQKHKELLAQEANLEE